jgi:hypothetical protein
MKAMSDSLMSTRNFYMHPAHRTIGVLRSRPAPASSHSDKFWKAEPGSEQKHLLFVADATDYLAQSALTLLERVLLGYGNVRCHRVSYASGAVERLSGADCILVFSHGFHVVHDWAATDADSLLDGPAYFGDRTERDVTVIPSLESHPVLEGVASFSSACEFTETASPPANATCLMEGRTSDFICPLGWIQEGRGRMFSTLLGQPADFQNRMFLRLALNAIAWVSNH